MSFYWCMKYSDKVELCRLRCTTTKHKTSPLSLIVIVIKRVGIASFNGFRYAVSLIACKHSFFVL